MTLWFEVVNSARLSPEQKELSIRLMGNRIGKDNSKAARLRRLEEKKQHSILKGRRSD